MTSTPHVDEQVQHLLIRVLCWTINESKTMHRLTVQTCAEYLVAAYIEVGAALREQYGLQVVTSNHAPATFEGLQADANRGLLLVSQEHSDTSIYGVQGNVAFRIMHDLGHLGTGLTFSTADEVALALHQWEQVRLCIRADWRERCQAVYQADTIMQSLYCERHGVFPVNQTEFVLAALAAYN